MSRPNATTIKAKITLVTLTAEIRDRYNNRSFTFQIIVPNGSNVVDCRQEVYNALARELRNTYAYEYNEGNANNESASAEISPQDTMLCEIDASPDRIKIKDCFPTSSVQQTYEIDRVIFFAYANATDSAIMDPTDNAYYDMAYPDKPRADTRGKRTAK